MVRRAIFVTLSSLVEGQEVVLYEDIFVFQSKTLGILLGESQEVKHKNSL